MNIKEIINCTEMDFFINDIDNNTIHIPKSEKVARLVYVQEVANTEETYFVCDTGECKIPIKVKSITSIPKIETKVEDLPPPQEGILYIVHHDVARFLQNERNDLLIPDPANPILDKDGNVIGYTNLLKYS